MKCLVLTAVFAAGVLFARLGDPAASADSAGPARPAAAPPANPGIDMPGYLKAAQEAAAHRESRRVTEDEFVRMSGEPGTVVLDARSREMYDLLHVKGAVNLSFPDITVESLKKTIPDKETRVLIYCNNNFRGSPLAFATKLPLASLNLSTYVALYSYGYRNVYELAPQLTLAESQLPFEGTLVR